jgi:hypothetical protein
MERSCRRRQGTRDGGDPGSRRPFLKTDGDRTDDNLDAGGLLGGWWFRRGHLDNHGGEFHCILRLGQNQLALPRQVLQDDRWLAFSP